MFLQLVWSKEAFITELAHVAVITTVYPHVVVQVIPACIALVALFTLKRLIFGVSKQMPLELVFSVERLHASSVTSKWASESWSCVRVVDKGVPLHFIFAGKCFSAFRTLVFLLCRMHCSFV